MYHAGAHRLFHGAGRQHCPHSAQRGARRHFSPHLRRARHVAQRRGLCRALTHDAARGTGHQRRLRLVHDGPERHRKRGAHDGERGLVSAQCAARDARYHSAARHRGQDRLYRGHHHPWHRLD